MMKNIKTHIPKNWQLWVNIYISLLILNIHKKSINYIFMYVLLILCYYKFMKLKKELFNYIESNTGWTIQDKKLDIHFPIYIKATYDLWSTNIADFGILFAKVKDKNTSMITHYNAIKKIEESCLCRVVLVFDYLDSRSVSRLTNKHIPFIVINKYIYMPFAFMQLQTNKQLTIQNKLQDLTADADTVLIGYLDNKIHNNMIIKDIAYMINREVRATSIALSILESLEYIHIEKHGREKKAYFITKEEIYEKLKQSAKSPIKYTFFSNQSLTNEHIVKSGYSAMSKFSTLIDNTIHTIAISSKEFSKIESNTIKCEKENALYSVEPALCNRKLTNHHKPPKIVL